MRLRSLFRRASGGAIPQFDHGDDVLIRLMEGGTIVATGPNLAPGPWDTALDVDPFTGQPDHPCGDSCEGGCE